MVHFVEEFLLVCVSMMGRSYGSYDRLYRLSIVDTAHYGNDG